MKLRLLLIAFLAFQICTVSAQYEDRTTEQLERKYKKKPEALLAYEIAERRHRWHDDQDSLWYAVAIKQAKIEYTETKSALQKDHMGRMIGLCYYQLQDYDQAYEWILKFRGHPRPDSETLLIMAHCQIELGDCHKAQMFLDLYDDLTTGDIRSRIENCSKEAEDNELLLHPLEQVAEYPGGESELLMFFAHNLSINEMDPSLSKVYVMLEIDTSGTATFNKLQNLPDGYNDAELREELQRLTALMPKWIPGMQRGRKVNSLVSIPLNVCFK